MNDSHGVLFGSVDERGGSPSTLEADHPRCTA